MTSATNRPGALQAWLQPPSEPSTSTKRKRNDTTADVNSSGNGDSELEDEPQAKAKKTREKAPVKPKATGKTKTATKATTSGNPAKEAKKLYADKLKEVEKRYMNLDKKVKAMSPNSSSVTVENYAIGAAKHAGVVTKLIDMATPVLAFNFAMALADASHWRITSHKMSGDGGDCCEPFEKLDKVLLAAIAAREQVPADSYLAEDNLPAVSPRFTEDDADVGEYKTGRPNKQQRGWLATAYIDWEKARRLARRERRESCEDWVRVARDNLVADRKCLDDRGIGVDFGWGADKREGNSYFLESIKKLEEMLACRSAKQEQGTTLKFPAKHVHS